MEALADAELKEKELQNSIVELQRKLSNTESKVRPIHADLFIKHGETQCHWSLFCGVLSGIVQHVPSSTVHKHID